MRPELRSSKVESSNSDSSTSMFTTACSRGGTGAKRRAEVGEHDLALRVSHVLRDVGRVHRHRPMQTDRQTANRKWSEAGWRARSFQFEPSAVAYPSVRDVCNTMRPRIHTQAPTQSLHAVHNDMMWHECGVSPAPPLGLRAWRAGQEVDRQSRALRRGLRYPEP